MRITTKVPWKCSKKQKSIMIKPWSHHLLSTVKQSFHGSRYHASTCWGKECVTFMFPAFGQCSQGLFIRSSLRLQSDQLRSSTMCCKHWGPPDNLALKTQLWEAVAWQGQIWSDTGTLTALCWRFLRLLFTPIVCLFQSQGERDRHCKNILK